MNNLGHEYDVMFEYGLRDGVLVHIDEVKNGIACRCVCPDCGTPLVAHNNPRNKKANHFQHKSKVTCTNAYETSLHYLAKQIILETKTLIVPDRVYSLSHYAQAYLETVTNPYELKVEKRKLAFDKVEVEKSEASFRPDIKCYIGDKVLLIEIAVTHFVDDIKKNRIYQNNLPLLEINLSKYDRSVQKDKLIDILNGNIEDMNWIFNPKINARKNDIIKRGQSLRDFVNANTRAHKVYGKNRHIYDCPIYDEHSGKIGVDDCCYHCRYFLQEWESVQQATGEPQSKYPTYTLFCIGHKASAFNKLLKSVGVELPTNL